MKKFISIFTILTIGFLIRVVGLNWDQGTFLHPDERFLVMVVQELKIPDSVNQYFSLESPAQVRNTKHSFYVYGSFPVVFTKFLSEQLTDKESFKNITYLGRWLTIIIETLNILLVFCLTEFLIKKYKLPNNTSLWSSLLYAFSVLPIQLSHFFTVDPFLTFFCLLTTYLISKINTKLSPVWAILSGLSFGLALASKISAIFFLPLIGVFIIYSAKKTEDKLGSVIKKTTIICFIFIISSYLSLRIFNPEYFSSSSWFNPTVADLFLKNIKTLASWGNPQANFPPALQWINRTPIIFSLKNIFFFGLGIWQSIFVLIGVVYILVKKTKSLISLVIIWLTGFILWQGSQFVQSLRYFYFIYPFLAILGAIGISYLQQYKKIKEYVFNLVVLVLITFWPLMFLNIFFQNHSRVEATFWIRENIPTNSKLLYEYWDDALPLGYAPGKNISYQTEAISIFDKDSDQKWTKINQQLATANHYILSSNRGWASITRLPEKYPQTTQFYEDLFSNKTNYYLKKVFQSNPSLNWLGINLSLDDTWSEEAFTVYDHPTIYIFENKLNN